MTKSVGGGKVAVDKGIIGVFNPMVKVARYSPSKRSHDDGIGFLLDFAINFC